jgi:hypothetical protein
MLIALVVISGAQLWVLWGIWNSLVTQRNDAQANQEALLGQLRLIPAHLTRMNDSVDEIFEIAERVVKSKDASK